MTAAQQWVKNDNVLFLTLILSSSLSTGWLKRMFSNFKSRWTISENIKNKIDTQLLGKTRRGPNIMHNKNIQLINKSKLLTDKVQQLTLFSCK